MGMPVLNKRTLPFAFGLLFAAGLFGQNSTTSGEFTLSRPRWFRSASSGASPVTTIATRKSRAGTERKANRAWQPALPLMRLQREEIGAAPGPNAANDPARYPLFRYTAANMFSGSILNLDPDTEYECRFTLSDPDGVTGAGRKRSRKRRGAYPEGAAAGRRRPRLPRLSGRLDRPQAGARVHRLDGRVLHGLGALRL